MYEIDFLPVGEGGRSGDAIAMRFTRPDTGAPAHVIVDAGFQDDGEALVEHVQRYYGTSSVDLAILTHPDGDHIGGMGEVLRGLNVMELWLHNLGGRGGAGLPAADAVADLLEVAEEQGTPVREAFAGSSRFNDALIILGPTVDYYEELVAEQQEVAKAATAGRPMSFGRPVSVRVQRFLSALPVEVPFGDAGGTSPRNNTSMVTLLELDGRQLLLTADAGVPALNRALDWAEEQGGLVYQPKFVQLAHHGSRHNASSAFLDRLLGPTGQERSRSAFVSVTEEAEKHPSPRVANGFMRRGYNVFATHGRTIWHHSHDAPPRAGWTTLTPLAPLDESLEEDE